MVPTLRPMQLDRSYSRQPWELTDSTSAGREKGRMPLGRRLERQVRTARFAWVGHPDGLLRRTSSIGARSMPGFSSVPECTARARFAAGILLPVDFSGTWFCYTPHQVFLPLVWMQSRRSGCSRFGREQNHPKSANYLAERQICAGGQLSDREEAWALSH